MSSVAANDAPVKWLATVQSSYIPWKGFFDLIRSVDTFVLLDDVQFSRGSWRNRNRIKTQHGVKWLTIPVEISGKFGQPINETKTSDPRWMRKHWDTIRQSYALAPHFREYKEWAGDLFDRATSPHLSEINYHFITAICGLLGITTPITWSTDYQLDEGKNERLISLCQQVGATHYLSGPAAKDYLDEQQFAEAGISVTFADYEGYPEYSQLYPPFDHYVSILDLIFNVGSQHALPAMKILR